MSQGDGRPVCVLGAGRSGTSLVAQALSLLGIYFGREEAMARPNELNPHGFWELLDAGALNEDVAASWREMTVDRPRPGWEEAPELEPFRARIEAIVERHFAGRGRWGFKHSGNTLTSPLWQSVVGEMDYVICVRNPLEVRASMEAGRDLLKLGPEMESPDWQLWAYAYCEALRNTAGQRRTFVFYGDWFADSAKVVDGLAAFLHGDTESVAGEVRERIVATVDDDLHRQRASELDLAAAEHVPIEVRALYFLMRDLAVAESRGGERARALQIVAAAMDRSRGETGPQTARSGAEPDQA
jgi:hypothetical protein